MSIWEKELRYICKQNFKLTDCNTKFLLPDYATHVTCISVTIHTEPLAYIISHTCAITHYDQEMGNITVNHPCHQAHETVMYPGLNPLNTLLPRTHRASLLIRLTWSMVVSKSVNLVCYLHNAVYTTVLFAPCRWNSCWLVGMRQQTWHPWYYHTMLAWPRRERHIQCRRHYIRWFINTAIPPTSNQYPTAAGECFKPLAVSHPPVQLTHSDFASPCTWST